MNNEPFLEFKDYPSTNTPLSATNLNNMQVSIADSIDSVDTKIGDLTTLTTTDKSSIVSAVNEVNEIFDGLVYTEIVTLASNITIKANSNYGSTQTKTISPRTGYTPIMVSLHNAYNRAVNLWYCNLASSTQINWNCSNNTSSQITGVSIQVRVLYIKSSCVAA